MLTIKPGEIKTAQMHAYMLASIAPRPIAFASTVDKNGIPNLAPFSFYNAFGSNPPVIVFSPARRVRDNTIKHTLENIYETKEVVINAVSYAMVQQTSLASCEYPKGVNEFTKAGFTAIASELVKPFRVKESPVQMECKVLEIKETGYEGGAANLIVCEIILMHINENVLNEAGKIDPDKIDLVARMGGDLYCRASGKALFEVAKPNTKLGLGIDSIPERIRLSRILTGNNLGQLGNADELPSPEDIAILKNAESMKAILHSTGTKEEIENLIHMQAKKLLDEGNVADAWKTLLST
ncbi:MAG: flavin reductase family protein [Bacteroidetes bacterium]|nr:flavin reductase family protein [Bacteroidota bacterium]